MNALVTRGADICCDSWTQVWGTTRKHIYIYIYIHMFSSAQSEISGEESHIPMKLYNLRDKQRVQPSQIKTLMKHMQLYHELMQLSIHRTPHDGSLHHHSPSTEHVHMQLTDASSKKAKKARSPGTDRTKVYE